MFSSPRYNISEGAGEIMVQLTVRGVVNNTIPVLLSTRNASATGIAPY